MNRKGLFYALSGIALLFFIFAVYISTFVHPKIVFTAEISKVSDADYKRILDNEQVP